MRELKVTYHDNRVEVFVIGNDARCKYKEASVSSFGDSFHFFTFTSKDKEVRVPMTSIKRWEVIHHDGNGGAVV